MTVTVIRIIKYQGDEAAVREAIQKSQTLGVRHCKDYVMTIAEHYNDLPKLIEIADAEVDKALEPK